MPRKPKTVTPQEPEAPKTFDPGNEFSPIPNQFTPKRTSKKARLAQDIKQYAEDFTKTGVGMSPAQSEATWSRVFELRKDIWKQLLHIPEVRDKLFNQLTSLYGKDIRPDAEELEKWKSTIETLKSAIDSKSVSSSLLERVSYDLAHSNEALMQGAITLAKATSNPRIDRILQEQNNLSQLKEYIVHTISRLVARQANRIALFTGDKASSGELFTDGMRGALKAIDKYDPNKGPFPVMATNEIVKQMQGAGSKASKILGQATSFESPTMGKNNEQGKDTLGDRIAGEKDIKLDTLQDDRQRINTVMNKLPEKLRNFGMLVFQYMMMQDLKWEEFSQALLDNHDMGNVDSKTGIKKPYSRQILNRNFNKFKDSFIEIAAPLFPERVQAFKDKFDKLEQAEGKEDTSGEPENAPVEPELEPQSTPEREEPEFLYVDKKKEEETKKDKPIGQHFSFESLMYNTDSNNNKSLMGNEQTNGDLDMAKFYGWLGNGKINNNDKKLNENMNKDFEDDESESEEDLWGKDEEDMWEDEDEDDEGFGESEYDLGKLEIQSEKYPDPEREGIVYQTLTYDGNEIGVVRTKEKTLSSTKRGSKFNMGGEGFKQVDYMLMAPKSPEYIENASWEPTGDPNIVFVVIGNDEAEVIDYLSEYGLPQL